MVGPGGGDFAPSLSTAGGRLGGGKLKKKVGEWLRRAGSKLFSKKKKDEGLKPFEDLFTSNTKEGKKFRKNYEKKEKKMWKKVLKARKKQLQNKSSRKRKEREIDKVFSEKLPVEIGQHHRFVLDAKRRRN
jgi:hypothetical protein